ncbi:c-type cytochrome [Octadecabacter sp. CECT 8868]|uniref:c-type cytochrome n=1 Tax=Octadecabacter algicola TaxID=2909342 RepID=UPI001F3A525D|nr:c-type cytochrome [Octadecabacter algicola]MCF2904130.1 c-type cytochrome [Octadecabacter algicola]
MSKSLNLFVPALGGTALIVGVAYGVATKNYGVQTIENLEAQLASSQAGAETASANVRAADEEIAQLLAERDALQAAVASGGGLTQPAPASDAPFNLGREALPEEIAAWDVDVLPDGRGLPVGSGDVWTGEEVFVEQCASCHGDFAEGSGNWPVLAGGFGTLADEDPVKTVGSYWPYLSTAFDYINRSMPFGAAGTLSADDTYAIVAYILYSNDMVDDDFVLSNETFFDVEMPNAGGFVLDDRAELEYAHWSAEPCMSDCKDPVEITMRASVVDVTPETEEEASAEHSMAEPEAEMTADAPQEAEVVEAAADPELIEAGQGVFRQCQSCHEIGTGASDRTGPQLNGIIGRTIGGVDGFRYSNVFKDAAEAGDVWTAEALDAYLADPRAAMPGTKMSFRGLRNPEDYAALLAYLQSAGAE